MSNKKGNSRKTCAISSDVTIYAHANSGTKTTRLKKTNKKIIENIIDEIEDVDDEIPDDILANSDDEEKSDENKNKKPSKKKIIERPNENHVYSDYHMDIWFLISEYISPENVGRFASICRKTDLVVSSPKFWFFMYKKYYNKNIQLPIRFHPDCMVRLGGLRSCVIRSLFYFYKPFVGRLKSMELKDFHCLNNKQCIAMWNNQSKDEWEFCFKFKRKNVPGSRAADSEKLVVEKKIIEMFSDIYMNTEEGCQILVITTKRFCPLPQNFGQVVILSSIVQTLSQGFINYKITMNFSNYCDRPIGSVVFDPVCKIKVLDWWNPQYYLYIT